MEISKLNELIQKIDNEVDKTAVKDELNCLFNGIKKTVEGLFETAQSADRFRENKLYKSLGFQTFEHFCREIIGFNRKQVYLYLRIADIIKKYPSKFDQRMVVMLGPSKMELIITGINKIENSNLDFSQKKNRINSLTGSVDFNMKVGEVEKIVKSSIKGIK